MVSGVVAGASGVIAAVGLVIGLPALAYGLLLGNDVKDMTIGDAGDLYLWAFELLAASTLVLVGGVLTLVGAAAAIVTMATGMLAFWRGRTNP